MAPSMASRFLVLQLQDFFFDGVARDEFVGGDDAGLADAMGAVGGLGFGGGIPPGIEVDDGVGGGEIQADAAGFEADEEDRNSVVVLEACRLLPGDLRLSRRGSEGNFLRVEALAQEVSMETN